MKTFTENDFEAEEQLDVWVTKQNFELFGKPVELQLSKGTSTSIEEAQLLVDQVITEYNVTPDDVVQRVSRATGKEADEVRDWVIPRIQIDYMAVK